LSTSDARYISCLNPTTINSAIVVLLDEGVFSNRGPLNAA
jgi:hypothetical protein